MVTRKVDKNEHLAGFIYQWVKKISQRVDQLFVITWQEGDASGLPDNVKVISLPTKANKLIKAIKLKATVRHYINDVDGVFCHQMPLYTILAAPIARRAGKKVVSWYMHRQVDWRVRWMEHRADIILSASQESFRLPSKKLTITGHGIDTEVFKPAGQHADSVFRIISVGRISPTKDYESMIKAVDILCDSGQKDFTLIIAGDVGLREQMSYFENLKMMITRMQLSSVVSFSGSISHRSVPAFLQQADLFINLSGTGSIDKAVLEAMASGCLVLTSNEAFVNILPSDLMVEPNNPKALAEKIKWVMSLNKEKIIEWQSLLREIVITHHNLDTLVEKIVNQFK